MSRFRNPQTGRYPLWVAVVYALLFVEAAGWWAGGHSPFFSLCQAAQWYMRPEAGDDGNGGTSWDDAWKTITGAAAVSIAAADHIYCEESPDPTSIGNALWTAGDRSVVLSLACAADMYNCENTEDEAVWTKAPANVTCASSTTRKEGATAASIAIAAGFTTGVVATANLNGDLDCSGYEQTSLWVRTNAALTANYVAIALYSDDYPTSALANVVHKFYLPAIPAANLWTPMTFDKGSAIGTVRTIALIAETDPGTVTFLIDNIIACKASDSADSLSLTSLISKNTANEPWFALASILGTAVELEAIGGLPTATFGCYGGTTETVETFKRETFKTTPAAATTTQVQVVQDSGEDGKPIVFAGGYTYGQDVDDGPSGLTIWDGGNGYGYGIYANAKSYITLSRLGATRYNIGFWLTGTQTSANVASCLGAATTSHTILQGNVLNTCTNSSFLSSGANGSGMSCNQGSAPVTPVVVSGLRVHGSNDSGVDLTTVSNAVFSDIYVASVASNYGIEIGDVYGPMTFTDYTAVGNSMGLCALNADTASRHPILVYNLTSSGHTQSGLRVAKAIDIELYDSSIAEATEVDMTDSYVGRCRSTNHDDTTGSHYKWEYGATYNTTQAESHTADGWAWQLSPTDTARSSSWPLRLTVGEVYLESGVATTVTCWARRDNTGLTVSLVCPGGQITGIASDVSDSVTEAADTWDQLSVALTSTETGMVAVEAQAYGGSTYTGYVDDIGCDQTGTFTGLDFGTGAGPAYLNAGGSGTTVYQWGGSF